MWMGRADSGIFLSGFQLSIGRLVSHCHLAAEGKATILKYVTPHIILGVWLPWSFCPQNVAISRHCHLLSEHLRSRFQPGAVSPVNASERKGAPGLLAACRSLSVNETFHG